MLTEDQRQIVKDEDPTTKVQDQRTGSHPERQDGQVISREVQDEKDRTSTQGTTRKDEAATRHREWERARYNISYVITGGLHKLYWSPGKKIKPYSWAWPFIDIIAYNNSKEGFRNIDLSKGHQFKAKTDLVYPLHMRPFGPVWVPAPRDPWRMMGLTYKKGTREFLCSEPHYDHIRERGRKGAKKNACEDLHGDDRFVYREPKLDGALIETLKLGDETLYSIEYDMRMLIRTNGRGHRDN
ncbi:hypothetical protein CAPTEDRAFT_207763 [Capitella teleta]|uniref:Uncharacterized protein n=1 Tax=Capitella teleta TaxID=283909 RepID=R7U349_CAPTE|nr:hypothetical protein CAPTEDRAFT_207763 [Capitella teleta]|eukprot:ELT98101.1 hypothetical protein CAPTEDRAFT_207763 [Capitella teleta]